MAYDDLGYRLGYGGGYYDKTISYLKSIKQSFLTVALAYDDQKIKNVVHDKHGYINSSDENNLKNIEQWLIDYN